MEVSFLYGDEMCDYNPLSEPLFKACINHDFDEIKKAIESGIDVNSFNEIGDTPIYTVVYSIPEEKRYSGLHDQDADLTESIIKILDYLLEKGANINLYGFDGGDILLESSFSGNLRVIEYLLQHGASKYLNCFLTDLMEDEWYVMNAAYKRVCMDIGIVGVANSDMINLLEQEKIMKKYGIEYYIEGWNEESVEAYYDSFPF